MRDIRSRRSRSHGRMRDIRGHRSRSHGRCRGSQNRKTRRGAASPPIIAPPTGIGPKTPSGVTGAGIAGLLILNKENASLEALKAGGVGGDNPLSNPETPLAGAQLSIELPPANPHRSLQDELQIYCGSLPPTHPGRHGSFPAEPLAHTEPLEYIPRYALSASHADS